MKNLFSKVAVLGIITMVLTMTVTPQLTWADAGAEAKKININTASVTELQALPRIGEKVAARIVDFRKENGNFKKIEELMKVKGIGEKTFANLKDLITVTNPSTSK